MLLGGVLSSCPAARPPAGYFKSRNCLREVRSALSKSKPLSLVFDPERGGAPLETIKAEEVPDDELSAVFGGRPVIEWHRIKQFQLVSLKLLAEGLLREDCQL